MTRLTDTARAVHTPLRTPDLGRVGHARKHPEMVGA